MVKPLKNNVLSSVGNAAKILNALHAKVKCDNNLSAWNQYYRPTCMSNSVESQICIRQC